MNKPWQNYALIALVAMALVYLFKSQKTSAPVAEIETAEVQAPTSQKSKSAPAKSSPSKIVTTSQPVEMKTPSPRPLGSPIEMAPQKMQTKAQNLNFIVTEDGLVTVDADIVLGTLQNSNATSGIIAPPTLGLWPEGRIPFHIQPHLENPNRVLKALEMFEDAPVRLTPQSGEQDMIVFEPMPSGCKSYVGRVGGKQPIWIGPECGPREIAHEIMHALGFIHEQNRSDRDAFVKIHWDNIQESAKINFELFPESMMAVSGGSPFDYRSIMIYSPTMFAKSSAQETMDPTDRRMVIEPSEGLTIYDIMRLDKVYGK